MKRIEYIEEIKEFYSKIKEIPNLRISKLRFVDIKHAHISTVRSAHKWAKDLTDTNEYRYFMRWWLQTSPEKWQQYINTSQTQLPEFQNMQDAKNAFQNMVITTTPEILWSKKRKDHHEKMLSQN